MKQPLTSMGFESLMAVELRNFIKSKIEVDIPMDSYGNNN
ncbi:acyl carrier protein [Moorena producens]